MKTEGYVNSDDRQTSLERYLLMSEKEKDAEIEKAVVRLQKRIQEILYLLGTEKHPGDGPGQKKDGALP